jgi:hypothetical protein
MIGWALTSCLATIGSSTVGGSWPRTRETRSRTSLAASSTLRLMLNSTVTRETCSCDEEVRSLTPSMVESCSSSTSVISVSTTCGLAPR